LRRESRITKKELTKKNVTRDKSKKLTGKNMKINYKNQEKRKKVT
jgi:hypothetical protein